MSNYFSTIRELFSFLWKEKIWWMIPCVITLLAVGVLIIFTHAVPAASLLYPMF